MLEISTDYYIQCSFWVLVLSVLLDSGESLANKWSGMLAYQFYLRNEIKGYEFVGVLPERRRNIVRITDESIINWGRKNFGRDVRDEDIFIVKVDLEEGRERKLRSCLPLSDSGNN